MDAEFFLKMFAALFAIMSPVANLPIFLSLTEDRSRSEQRSIALTVTVGLMAGCIVVALAGNMILEVFGISLDAFRLAGGFLILLIALNLLSGQQSASHHGNDDEKAHHAETDNPGIYPLTVPILLGPGTVSTLIIFRGQAETVAKEIAYALAAGASVALLAVTFVLAPQLGTFFGKTATSVMSRLMGMILAAIAMEMMVSSLKVLLPGLA